VIKNFPDIFCHRGTENTEEIKKQRMSRKGREEYEETEAGFNLCASVAKNSLRGWH
jgi:hypothetical protein